MNSQHTKILNTDKDGKNRLKFTSSRKLANLASADVYRSYKRRIGVVTSASGREEDVHNPASAIVSAKKRRKRSDASGSGVQESKGAFVLQPPERAESDPDDDGLDKDRSLFASELEIASDRNASEIFGKFHREVWHLVRSLPEVLHHSAMVIDLLLSYMLSPESKPGAKSLSDSDDDVEENASDKHDDLNDDDEEVIEDQENGSESLIVAPSPKIKSSSNHDRPSYIVNQATTDILHLIAVLARDLRHEIHPYVHTKILPRIVIDLLNPPLPPPDSGKQPIPLDVNIVEAAFRTLSYIFLYDSEPLLQEIAVDDKLNVLGVDQQQNIAAKKSSTEPCLERMRQYYGMTVANRRDLIRRLASESFAGLIRKLPSDSAKKRHLRRVVKALATSASSNGSDNRPNATSLRLQQDAVDGISQLLFEVARGVSGQLHSKADSVVIKVLLDFFHGDITKVKKELSVAELDATFSVVSAFMDRICRHLEPDNLAVTLSKVIEAAQRGVGALSSRAVEPESIAGLRSDVPAGLSYLLKLVTQLVSYRNGSALHSNAVVVLEALLSKSLERDVFLSFTFAVREAVMTLFCTVGTVLQRDNKLLDRMSTRVRGILSEKQRDTIGTDPQCFSETCAFAIIRGLMANIHVQPAMYTFGSVLIEAAFESIPQNPKVALQIVYGLSSLKPSNFLSQGEVIDDSDDIFFLDGAAACSVSDEHKEALLLSLLVDVDALQLSRDNISHIAAACQCVSFLALTGGGDTQNKMLVSCYKRVSSWLLHLMEKIRMGKQGLNEDDNNPDAIRVLMAIAIESYSRLSIIFYENTNLTKLAISRLENAQSIVEEHMMANPANIWAMKSASTFVSALKAVNLKLQVSSDLVFDSLIPNLREGSHFLRLHSLKILSSLPHRVFVVDHADLDLTGDLDEEVGNLMNKVHQADSNAPTGTCRLIDTLFEIESTPIAIGNERSLVSMISRVEVQGRTGKLPIVYAEAAASHMLGLLHVKFAPIWPAAAKALVGLIRGHEKSVWQGLHHQLLHRMNKFPYGSLESNAKSESEICSRLLSDSNEKISLMIQLERSRGMNANLFAEDISAASDQGRVSRHHNADDGIILQSLWTVVESVPSLISTYSRSIVPIFLQFMKLQYYHIHPEDPDSREMKLDEFLCDLDCQKPNPELSLNSRAIQNRLISMLKVFSTLSGPQQLYRHNLLLPIFVSFVGHPDTETALLAVRCVLRFKPSYLLPLADTLNDFFGKGKLRNAMMHFKTAFDSAGMNPKDRKQLLTFISRILFGRLSARATGARTSKDSPSSRRIAIVTFLSSICEGEDELFPFIFLMVRVYLPPTIARKPIELLSSSDHVDVLSGILALTSKDCLRLPLQVHQGFLNVLEALLSQVGHRIVDYVPAFMSIVLALCKAFVAKEASSEGQLSAQDNDVECDEKVVRAGAIRSLCYRRLVDIFSKFAESIDFKKYSTTLWSTQRKSLELLPEMVVNSDDVPSLLILLKTMSMHPSLVKMLADDEDVVPTVLKCLSESSKPAVMEAILSFIDNLMSSDEAHGERIGQGLIKKNILLLLQQFQSRVSSSALETLGRKRTQKKSAQGSPSLRRELRILCSVSNAIGGEELESENTVKVFESLCSLLLPFLEIGRGISDDDRIIVLELVGKLIARVSADSAQTHFVTLSALLGSFRGKPGISTKIVRTSITSVVQNLASTIYPCAIPVANALRCLCAVDEKRVDEMNYDIVIPILSGLGDACDGNSWSALSKSKKGSDASLLLPVIACSFHFLFNEDGVVSRGAFKALKTLITLAGENSKFSAVDADETIKTVDCLSWRKLLQGTLIPSIRAGIASSNTQARRFYILLLGEVARRCKDSKSPNLYGDLSCLVREDEPDLDFFVNITHVQIHRHAKALQRLRKMLAKEADSETCSVQLSLHSISNILLPLATHPIYESKMKIEESIALESIATVGAISRHLSWSKYSTTLWTHLNQFDRHPEQEKYVIGLICAIIDGFHFTIEDGNLNEVSSVWRTLESRIIPKVKTLLTKEKVDKKGTKNKVLRSSVVLALLKLFNKFPSHHFQAKLPQLLTVICHALTNKDSDARDVARATVAKMVLEMDLMYLPDVLRDLAITLNEGFKLHVLSATVHTILLELSKVYKPEELPVTPESAPPAFDRSVPALMDLLQQDLFGTAQERKDVQGAQVRHVKEAGGSKALHSIELIASMIQFKPSLSLGGTTQTGCFSSVHALVMPLLSRLRSPDLSSRSVRRIKECLSRAANGLIRNSSLLSKELLPFVQSTLQMFVCDGEINAFMASISDDFGSDDENPARPIHVSGKAKIQTNGGSHEKAANAEVVEWRPSTLNAASSTKDARLSKQHAERKSARVLDGAVAPKLTGNSRYRFSGVHATSLNNPAITSAVTFNLQLLSSVLRRSAFTPTNEVLDQFVSLLTTCVCRCRDSEVMLLSMRCLNLLLRKDLPSLRQCSTSLASKTLDLLTSSGSNQDIVQATYKMLTFLINSDHNNRKQEGLIQVDLPLAERENVLAEARSLPLNAEKMQVLVSFLREAVVDSNHHNAAIGLIKSIMSHRYVSAEFYDLMETALEQSVRNSTSSAREQFSRCFAHYFINYPLSSERIEQHLKQAVLNLGYEYAEGRLSAIRLVNLLFDKLPEQMIKEHCQLFFLPLSLQLVNDDSKDCREAVARCIGNMLKALSTESLQSLYGFTERWSQGNVELRRTSLQLFSIFVDVRVDFMKRDLYAKNLLKTITQCFEEFSDHWEIAYFSLILVEKMTKEWNQLVVEDTKLWSCILPAMTNVHAWVRLVSARLIMNCLTSLDPEKFTIASSKHFLVQSKGSLHQIARNLCFQLASEEEGQSEELTAINVKSLTWAVQAMQATPDICFCEQTTESSDPVRWVMSRLSNIARPKGSKRRQAVYKCFAAFASFCGRTAFEYLELMLEPLHRSESEARNISETAITAMKTQHTMDSDEAQFAKEVLNLLEERCDDHERFLHAYTRVKTEARDKKEKRKNEVKTEAIVDPMAAAKRRIGKQEQEKKRRRRRVDDRRHGRGATAKRRHVS